MLAQNQFFRCGQPFDIAVLIYQKLIFSEGKLWAHFGAQTTE